MSLTWRIIEARLKAGLSQRQLAKKAGISNSTVARFEQGKEVGMKKIIAMEKALGFEESKNDKEALLDENARLRLKLNQVQSILEGE